MNDTIETLGISVISGLPTMVVGNGVVPWRTRMR